MSIKSLAVFCGSKPGNNPVFESDAKELGKLLAQKNIGIVYGGGNKGLMGAVANAALEQNGRVTGIIPRLLTEWESQHTGVTELLVVETMHIRKQMMYEKSDAAIILPGGYGTLDELFEMLTWNQLSIHNKKIFFLNSGGFYNHLFEHIKMMDSENLLYLNPDEQMKMLNHPADILPFI
ncbi:MAG: TIGR00730 family Rossman fold protein [Ferruginibacter sp.]